MTILLPLEVIQCVEEAGMITVTLLTMHQNKVLLFGQSAGATASFALATLPEITSLVNAVGKSIGGL